MGDGCGGCQERMATSVGIGHFSDAWLMLPGCFAVSSTFKAWRMMRVCPSTSNGCPKVCPNGNSTARMRGVPTRSAQKGIFVTRTVESPSASSVRANTGTLIAQSGQAGVSKTQSTPSSLSNLATFGPYVFCHSDALGGKP
jgi:hypothetical protein